MRFWNDGKDEASMVQNRFTKYLVVAVHRKKSAVLQSYRRILDSESSTDDWDALPGITVEEDYAQQISSPLDFENAALSRALAQLKERERYIFFAHILDERGFSDLAAEFSMGYKGIAAAYYRAIEKIKKEMRGEEP